MTNVFTAINASEEFEFRCMTAFKISFSIEYMENSYSFVIGINDFMTWLFASKESSLQK